MADDTENDVLALELVLELAEPVIETAPVPDRRALVEACVRVRRIALALRAGIAIDPPPGGTRHQWN